MILYNEIEPFAVQWLRNLMFAGELPWGEVNDRPIQQLEEKDFEGVTQFHGFAGIGGWPYALRLAGWPDDRDVWTLSFPCQPFSTASPARKRMEDERHLWPFGLERIAKFRPPTIFGEQVASKDGRIWLDRVRVDLEALGYRVGAADLCSAGVTAPHIRQRLHWVADRDEVGLGEAGQRQPKSGEPDAQYSGSSQRLAVAERDAEKSRRTANEFSKGDGTPRAGAHGELGRRRGLSGISDSERVGRARESRRWSGSEPENDRTAHYPWDQAEFRRGNDGKTRRIEPGLSPLAHGVPNRVGRLRGYGNAIVPQLAAQFVRAYMDAKLDLDVFGDLT